MRSFAVRLLVRAAGIGAVAALVTLHAWPQVPAAQPDNAAAPSFEVASVKQSPSDAGNLVSLGKWGTPRFTATNVTMNLLLQLAFGVRDSDIEAGPSWLGSQKYDIDAKTEGEKSLTFEQAKPLLQKLLAERFKLAVHHRMKDFPGYVLVAAKSGSKLKPSSGASGPNQILPDQLQCQGCPLDSLAAELAIVTGAPVVNQTGIAGNYDIRLTYAPRDDTDSALPSIFTAVQETLGLRQESRKVPVEMLVIDHVERVPTEN